MKILSKAEIDNLSDAWKEEYFNRLYGFVMTLKADVKHSSEEVSQQERLEHKKYLETLKYVHSLLPIDTEKIDKDKSRRETVIKLLKLFRCLKYRIKPYVNSLSHTREFFDNYPEIKFLVGEELPTDKPIVFIFNHFSANDILNSNEIVGLPAQTLIATDNGLDPNLIKMLGIIGTIEMNRNSYASCIVAYQEMSKILNYQTNLIGFPEATWNYRDNSLALDFYRGLIKVAIENDAYIVEVGVVRTKGNYVYNAGPVMDLSEYKTSVDYAVNLSKEVMDDLIGQMVFDKTVQKSKSRDKFNPEKELKKIFQKEAGFKFNREYEEDFIHEGKKTYYDSIRKETIGLQNPEDIAGLYQSCGKKLVKKLDIQIEN